MDRKLIQLIRAWEAARASAAEGGNTGPGPAADHADAVLDELVGRLVAGREERHGDPNGPLLDRIRDACPRELRPELEQRIRAYDELTGAVERLGRPRDWGPAVPARIEAAFDVIETLPEGSGRGGQGIVYRAIDRQLGRTVALKFPRGIDARRLENEARILSRLEHPGIVPFFGWGADQNGLRCYAMRMLDGPTLSAYLPGSQDQDAAGPMAAGRLEGAALLDALRIFLGICSAIEYAHARGILHRDLHPWNVIIQNGEPIVVDWGLAKPITAGPGGLPRPDTEPSRADGEPSAADDVGGPFPAGATTEAATPSDPSPRGRGRPLTRLDAPIGMRGYRAPELAATSGAHRAEDPRCDVFSLGAILQTILTGTAPTSPDVPRPMGRSREVPRPLRSICAKALHSDRDRRYESVAMLSRDVTRWMAGEKVEAHDESALERMVRWVRRHRTWTTTAAVAGIVLLAALATTVVLQIRARNRLEAARRIAQSRFEIALEAVKAYHTGAGEFVLRREPRLQDLRRRLLTTSVDFYEKLAHSLAVDEQASPRSLAALAGADMSLGTIHDEVGSQSLALAAFHHAREILERLVRDDPRRIPHRLDLASCLNLIGAIQGQTGLHHEAIHSYERTARTLEDLVRDRPVASAPRALLGRVLSNLGGAQASTGQADSSLANFNRAREVQLALVSANPEDQSARHDLALTENNLADHWIRNSEPVKALDSFRQARDSLDQLVRDDPTSLAYQNDLATAHNNIAQTLFPLGRTTEALDALEKARVLLERLVKENPTFYLFRGQLATTLNGLGITYAGQDDMQRARDYHLQARELLERVVDDQPDVEDWRRDLAATNLNIAIVTRDLGSEGTALDSLAKARAILEHLGAGSPTSTPRLRIDLAHCIGQTGLCLAKSRPQEALQHLLDAASSLENLPDLTGYDEFNLACYLSQCIPLITENSQKTEVALRAVHAVQRAIGAGVSDRQLYQSSKDLKPLGGREDFEQLMRSIQKAGDRPA